MVELRKRPAPAEVAAPPPLAKRNSSSKIKKLADKAKAAVTGGGGSNDSGKASSSGLANEESADTATPTTTAAAGANGTGSKAKAIAVGDVVDLDTFGGEVETHDGAKVTVKQLLEKSGAGIVLFTYPKASTPGCTTQACAFRDSYTPITGAALAVYGLSTDSPKSNTTFATKQKLPYQLLCDPKATLIKAIGMKKSPSGTSRGVVLIDKQGKVRVWFQGGPQKTVDEVLEYVKNEGISETGGSTAVAAPVADDPHATEAAAKLADHGTEDVPMLEAPLIRETTKEEKEAADVAAEVGETAAKIDSAEA